MHNQSEYVSIVMTPTNSSWASLLREVRTEPNKLETGYREGEKIQKGDKKMRKAKRGW